MAKQNLDELIEQSEEAIEKGNDLSEVEAEHHHKEKSKVKNQKSKVEEKIKKARFEKLKSKKETVDIEEPKAEESEEKTVKTEKEETKKPKTKKVKKGKVKVRGGKYQKVKALIDVNKKYDIASAIELVKKTSTTSFDGNIEAHARILNKVGKPEKIRGLIRYPYQTGKKIRAVILDEKKIDAITQSSKIDADIYIASPSLMPAVVRLAKILGPKGKMPDPKSGTISTDPQKTKRELESGQTEYKTDAYGIVHQVIGKVSQKNEELAENLKALKSVLPIEKISSINLCATMGPAVKVQK